jgi:single-stranded DNA-binding protein
MFKINAIGNLGSDAELRTSNGKEYMTFSIGCRTGKDETQWVSVSSYQTNLAQYLKKGGKVFVDGMGRLTEKDGKTYCNLSATTIQLLGSNQQESQAQAKPKAPTQTPTPQNDDDLPF